MGVFWKAVKTVMTGVNYFNVDEYGTVRRGQYKKPSLDAVTTDKKGYPVLHITAQNYRDAEVFTEGTTYPGDVSRTLVHLGGDKWEERIEPWKTSFKDSDLEETKPRKVIQR